MLTLYGSDGQFLDFEQLQAEVQRDQVWLTWLEQQHHTLRLRTVRPLYRSVHPSRNLETLKGVGQDSAAVYVSFIGDPRSGHAVDLKGYGFILVFRIDTPDGDTEYWASSDLTLTMDERETLAGQIWTIEVYHRGLKQFCGVEGCAARKARAQRNHIG